MKEKEIIPTAEEFWNDKYELGTDIPLNIMKEFAKLHVTAALKKAAKSATTDEIMGIIGVNEESILKAYPLDQIK